MGKECHAVLTLLEQKMENMEFQDILKTEKMAKTGKMDKMDKVVDMEGTAGQVFMGMEGTGEMGEMLTKIFLEKRLRIPIEFHLLNIF